MSAYLKHRIEIAYLELRKNFGSYGLSRAAIEHVSADREAFVSRLVESWEQLEYQGLDPIGQACVQELLFEDLSLYFPEGVRDEEELEIPKGLPVRAIQLASLLERMDWESLVQQAARKGTSEPDLRLLRQFVQIQPFPPGRLASFLVSVVAARLVQRLRAGGLIVWRALPELLLVVLTPSGTQAIQHTQRATFSTRSIQKQEKLGGRDVTLGFQSLSRDEPAEKGIWQNLKDKLGNLFTE